MQRCSSTPLDHLNSYGSVALTSPPPPNPWGVSVSVPMTPNHDISLGHEAAKSECGFMIPRSGVISAGYCKNCLNASPHVATKVLSVIVLSSICAVQLSIRLMEISVVKKANKASSTATS